MKRLKKTVTGKVEPFYQANASMSSFHLTRGRFIADCLRSFSGKTVRITIEEVTAPGDVNAKNGK